VAVGDLAAFESGGIRQRHEHWTNASEQAGVAVANLLAGTTVRQFAPSGYVWSDQYAGTLQLAGQPRPDDEVVFETGGPDEPAFVATYRRGGVTVGVFALNSAKQFTRLRRQALRRPAPVA
jgi:NADPH-dependent 2,4-dienoyl-CoA reductase/sulfur reductase-like enzyme